MLQDAPKRIKSWHRRYKDVNYQKIINAPLFLPRDSKSTLTNHEWLQLALRVWRESRTAIWRPFRPDRLGNRCIAEENHDWWEQNSKYRLNRLRYTGTIGEILRATNSIYARRTSRQTRRQSRRSGRTDYCRRNRWLAVRFAVDDILHHVA